MNETPLKPDPPPAALFRIEDFLRDASFPHPVIAIELRETHISWVVLTGTYAYKIKKAVRLDFLDATALSTRRFLCEEELRLNRRLAPELYESVVTIGRRGTELRVNGPGSIVEYAVRMRQFSPAEELTALLARGDLAAHELTSLAERLAEFHASAARPPGGEAYPFLDHLRRSVQGTQATLLRHLGSMESLPPMGPLIERIQQSLQALTGRLGERHEQGFVRECHGDLHAGNIVRWGGRLTPFDCVEFDPLLRFIDPIDDIAFLVMDLTAHGRGDLAYAFLDRYAERTGDYQGLRLLPFYGAHRALVRAMVDGLAAEQQPEKRHELDRRLRARVSNANAYMTRARPLLLLTHGPSGSGKSWLSERLVSGLPAIRIRSDVERRRMSGSGIDPSRAQDRYSQDMTRRTYARLAECAESAVDGGTNIIVDAAFLRGEDRDLLRAVADRGDARFIIVSCLAAESTMADRIDARLRDRSDPSEADVSVLRAQLARLEPLRPDELADVIEVDSTASNAVDALIATLRSRMAQRDA